MRWSQIKMHLKSIFLLHAKSSYHEISVTAMLSKSFARHWEEYPWKITETIRFECLSSLGDIYLVEKVRMKRYLLADGQVQTEIADCKEWKAVFHNTTHVLMELSDDMRLIAFMPEKMKILFGPNDYDVNR